MATFIGNAKETFDYWANSGKGTERELEFEAWSDQWNNELGRRIGMFVKKHGLPTTDIASMVSDAFDTRGVANGRVDPRYSEGGYGRSPSWEQPSQKWFKNTLQGCSYSTQEKLTIPMLKECRTRNAKDFLTPN